jgi:hypothetical protein
MTQSLCGFVMSSKNTPATGCFSFKTGRFYGQSAMPTAMNFPTACAVKEISYGLLSLLFFSPPVTAVGAEKIMLCFGRKNRRVRQSVSMGRPAGGQERIRR